jgi:hypothetical protein
MSTMRPRGLSFSSCRFTYVGQACRQKPQCTQASMPGSAAASGVPGSAQGAAAGMGACGIVPPEAWELMRVRPRRGCRG